MASDGVRLNLLEEQVRYLLALPRGAPGGLFSVKDYGARGDGATDDYAAIVAADTAAAAADGRVYFPHGTYAHATPFSLTAANMKWEGNPGTRLKYTGGSTTNQFTFDGSASGNGRRIEMRNLIFDSNALCTNGLLLRLATRGLFENLRVTNCTAVGMLLEACTLSTFINPTVSGNVETFTTTPTTGMKFQAISGGAFSGAAGGALTVITPILEGVSGVGIDISDNQGITILGGTSEGNGTGLKLGAGAILGNVIGCDFEANTVRDLELTGGDYNVFTNCLFASTGGSVTESVKILTGSVTNQFHGCRFVNVVIDSGASDNQFIGSMFTSASTQIADSGTRTTVLSCYNASAGNMITSLLKGAYDFQTNVHAGVSLSVVDGATAPTAVAGRAFIYVDTADGDLKVRFGDNVTKTLAADT